MEELTKLDFILKYLHAAVISKVSIGYAAENLMSGIILNAVSNNNNRNEVGSTLVGRGGLRLRPERRIHHP